MGPSQKGQLKISLAFQNLGYKDEQPDCHERMVALLPLLCMISKQVSASSSVSDIAYQVELDLTCALAVMVLEVYKESAWCSFGKLS